MFFKQIKDPRLAQYAYVVGDPGSGEALVIDPLRDVDQYVELAEAEGLTINAVAETHIHADFLSGARELAHRHGAKLYLSGAGGPDWQPEWALAGGYDLTLLENGSTFTVGNVQVTAVHTPGHTPEHMTFLLGDASADEREPARAVTGDFIFVGDLGRPDLLESAAGIAGAMRSSAETLYRSVQAAMAWPDDLQLWPGHGAGSTCGKALGSDPFTTWGSERQFSPAIQAASAGESAFVEHILAGQPEPPLYFARMKRLNRIGVPLVGEPTQPAELAVDQLADLAGRLDLAVLDTRPDRADFMHGHLPGSLHAPLDDLFHTVAGSYVDPEAPVYVIAAEDEIDDVVRDLLRIGIDRVEGWSSPDALARYGQAGGALASTRVVDSKEAGRILSEGRARRLDVRSATELAAEAQTVGGLNIAHTRLTERLDELPDGVPLLVHCATGRRAARAAALLQREGYDVMMVDGALVPDGDAPPRYP